MCLLKSYLRKRSNCELSLDDLKEPVLAWGRGTAMRRRLCCSCTYCSSLVHKSGKAEPSSAGLFFTPHSDCSPGWVSSGRKRSVCAGSIRGLFFVESTFWEKKTKQKKQKWTTISLSNVLRSQQRSFQRSILFTAADESNKCWSCAIA